MSGNSDPERRHPSTSRGKWALFAGRLLMVLTLISVIITGLPLNALQFILTLSIKLSGSRTWKRLHKHLNGHLLYAIFAQPVFILYCWSRIKLNILLDDKRILKALKRDFFAVLLANHTFQLDWMASFVLADQMGNLGSCKSFSKDEIKYLPIIGWAFWMSDIIYVKRRWNEDKLSLNKQLDALLDYDQCLLGIFAEGTRWTAEKYQDSIEFAEASKLEPYKHHLFPRHRGFTYTMRHYLRCQANEPDRLGGKEIRLFNLEIALPDRPTFRDFLDGRQIRADIYFEEVALTDELKAEALSSSDEDDCPKLTELLRAIYRRKDELLDEYENNGHKFVSKSPNSCLYPIRKPVKAFAHWAAAMTFTYGTLVYMAWTRFARSLSFWSCILLVVAGGILLLRRIERESKPTRLKEKVKAV